MNTRNTTVVALAATALALLVGASDSWADPCSASASTLISRGAGGTCADSLALNQQFTLQYRITNSSIVDDPGGPNDGTLVSAEIRAGSVLLVTLAQETAIEGGTPLPGTLAFIPVCSPDSTGGALAAGDPCDPSDNQCGTGACGCLSNLAGVTCTQGADPNEVELHVGSTIPMAPGELQAIATLRVKATAPVSPPAECGVFFTRVDATTDILVTNDALCSNPVTAGARASVNLNAPECKVDTDCGDAQCNQCADVGTDNHCIASNIGDACGSDQNPDDCLTPACVDQDGTGVCLQGQNNEPPGTACESDGNICTDDQCDASGQCLHLNNTDPCDDGSECTTDDTCSGGECVGGPPPDCNDGNVCTTDSCNPQTPGGCVHTDNDDPCDDGSECTTDDTCSGGECVGGPPPDCNDGNVCTDDSCNPQTPGGCVHTNNTDPCNDGSECTTDDTCSGGECVGGPPPNCNDENVCTTDSCNPAIEGGCVHANNTDPCDDGDECTTDDTCSGGECQGGPPPNCNDENVCTTDSCNPQTPGGCVHTNNTEPCDDGSECTTDDTCSGGECQGGPPPNCDDENVCTTDSCDPQTPGGCVHTNNTEPCDDGSECTTDDACSGGTCQGGPPPNCDDENLCTTDSCDPQTPGGCVHTNNSEPCDDANVCTTDDTCDGGECVGGPPLDCDDGNVCTTDSCNPASEGGCVHTDNTEPCDDGAFCTVDDTCNGGTCVGSPRNCGDEVACTIDSCNEETDSCQSVPDDDLCDDGDSCTHDTCDAGSGCHHEYSCRDICRSWGFYGRRAGDSSNGTNIVQSILDAVGGLEVCGQTITETTNPESPYLEGLGLDSAVEGMCVRVQKVAQRSLYRALVTTALNCAVSGSDDCDAVVAPFIDVSFSQCDAVCTSGEVGSTDDKSSTAWQCIKQLDCYNRGGQMYGNRCALGRCSVTGKRCGADYGLCPPVMVNLVTYMQHCKRYEGNCRDADFCQPALDVCPLRRRSTSKAACKEAKRNSCTIDSCD